MQGIDLRGNHDAMAGIPLREPLDPQALIPNWNPVNANQFAVARESERRRMEAGGVEPPSEKRYATEPTCLSQFRLVRPPRLERARNAAG